MKSLSLVVAFLALSFSTTPAQQPILTMLDSVKLEMNGRRLAIHYGRPIIRGKKIIGEFVPYNRVWRTGAGGATILETDADLRLGDLEIPRGAYSLYTFPTPTKWKLIVNKQTGQWGTIYNSDLDYGRTNLTLRKLKTPVQDLRFVLEKNGNGGGLLKIEWEYTLLSVPFRFLQDSFLASPRDSTKLHLGGTTIAIHYSRPSRRGRTIMGGVVPYHEIWRTGANEATSFVTSGPLLLGGAEIPEGAYTLYTLPGPARWKLIVNKQTGQWGTEYDRAHDLVRVDLKKESVKKSVEKFTVVLEKKGARSGVLKLVWENTLLSVPIELRSEAAGKIR